ncbi:MAG: hypothetical protein AB8B61_05960 [Cyclobacteriaceae bacterium]
METYHYTIDSPAENSSISTLQFELRAWVACDFPLNTPVYFTDGKHKIELTQIKRTDVEQAFPDKHIIAISQEVSILDIELDRVYAITFQGKEKEHRFLVPIQITKETIQKTYEQELKKAVTLLENHSKRSNQELPKLDISLSFNDILHD